MSSIALRPATLAVLTGDLVRYGIEVTEADLICIDIHPVLQDVAEPISMEGCEVVELPTEVVINEFPGSYDNWCEIVPVRRRSPLTIKEICNDYRTGT